MQKKQLNKILIIALALIWGAIIFKYVSPFFYKKDGINEFVSIPNNRDFKAFKRDTFLLKTVTIDPFLGKSFAIKKEPSTQPKKRRSTEVKKNIIWPKISYLGFVKSNQNKNRLGLVRINKQLFKVRKGFENNGIKVLRIRNDSILLSLNNQKKYFSRK